MKTRSHPLQFLTLALACLALMAAPAGGRELRIAVAANFAPAASDIAAAFEAAGGTNVSYSLGATGLLYAQISQGAPFDVFLAADEARPARAIAEGFAVAGSAFTYARGRLALYQPDATPELPAGRDALAEPGPARLAIANPATAPYGAAALQVLAALGRDGDPRLTLLRGVNVTQAHQFVATGNAEMGLVAAGLLHDAPAEDVWLIPESLHLPLRQDAVLLASGADRPAARGFLAFLRSPAAREIIRAHGYEVDG